MKKSVIRRHELRVDFSEDDYKIMAARMILGRWPRLAKWSLSDLDGGNVWVVEEPDTDFPSEQDLLTVAEWAAKPVPKHHKEWEYA